MNSVTEHLGWMRDRVKARQPFCHLRFNDGEAIAMGLLGEPEGANCDGHRYFPDMGRALTTTLMAASDDDTGEVLLGSIIETDRDHQAAKALAVLIPSTCLTTVGEFWCQEEKVEGWDELRELFGAIRDRPSLLISNSNNRMAKKCLNSGFLEVPAVDAWSRGRRVVEDSLHRMYGDEPVYIWACGFPGKVWAWMLRTLIPGSTHIDIGHTFDGVYGNKSREWMKRDSEMSRFYFNTFAPWVRSFER